MPTIGLTMIVKNETAVIRRCLDSVHPLIDFARIVDTGSDDGTPQAIRDWLHESGVPGEVLSRPWRNFAANRTEALEALREIDQVDYALTIDADEILRFDPGFDAAGFKDGLDRDLYDVQVRSGDTRYLRPALFSNRKPFVYKAVLHEYLEAPPGVSRGLAEGFYTEVTHDGARSRNPTKFLDDAELLERALATETDPFLRARYTFYCAQSYRDAGRDQQAYDHYLARAEMGFWVEEVYLSLLQAARLAGSLGHDPGAQLQAFLRAYELLPLRAEALHGAARLCRIEGWYHHGYLLAAAGVELEPPQSGLFVESRVYDWQMLDEFAILAYWSGHYEESLEASLRIFEELRYPPEERERLLKNADFARQKLQAASAPLQRVGA